MRARGLPSGSALRRLGLIAFVLATACGSTTQPTAPGRLSTDRSAVVRDFQLLNASEGWALSSKALSWTGDGGESWATITPPEVAAS
jgi:hypothetical protein